MKPSELSRLIGVAASTIRAWSAGEYRVYLTPSGQGGGGASRHFTELDARIFLLIAQLKQRGTNGADIHYELNRQQADGWQDLPDLPHVVGAALVPVVAQSTATAALEIQTKALMREIATLQNHAKILESDLAASREKSEVKQESLLRELGDAKGALLAAEQIIKLYESGRLTPPSKE